MDTSARHSLMATVSMEFPELLAAIEALRKAGGDPALAYLAIGDTVVRDRRDEFSADPHRPSPKFGATSVEREQY
ncbi:MAG: hypothetical protein ABL985_05965 [Casimicrobium sp.]